MKKLVSFLLISSVLMLQSLSNIVYAVQAVPPYFIKQITGGETTGFRTITDSDGEKFVWEQSEDSGRQVYLYDGTQVKQLTHDAYPYVNNNSKIDGDYVAWARLSNNDGGKESTQLFIHNIATSQTTQITDNTYIYKAISSFQEGKLVWQAIVDENSYYNDLFVYDVATSQTDRLTFDGEQNHISNTRGHISGDELAWERYNPGNPVEIFKRDLNTSNTLQITSNNNEESIVDFSNGRITWTESTNYSFNVIYSKNGNLPVESPVDNHVYGKVAVDENFAAWNNYLTGQIILLNLDTMITDPIISGSGLLNMNGKTVSLLKNEPTQQGFTNRELYLYNIDTYILTKVSNGAFAEPTDFTPVAENFVAWVGDTGAGVNDYQVYIAGIDSIAPEINYTVSPLSNEFGWNSTDVTVEFNCADDFSGIQSCTAPVILTTEGTDQSVTGTAVDNAGNTASVNTQGINIDKTLPSVNNVQSDPAVVLFDGIVTFTADVADTLSGIQYVEYYIDSDPGQGNGTAMSVNNGKATAQKNVSGLLPGQHTLYVRAMDTAGNWSIVESNTFVRIGLL